MTMDDLDHNPSNATRDGHKRGRSTPGSDDAAPKKARTERASSSSSSWTSEESSENEYTLPKGSGRARTAARNPAGADSEDEPPAAQAASTSAAVGLGDNRPTAVPNLVSRSIRGRPTREATGRGVDRRPATVTRRGR
ncbi:hypothetical protein K466DRAFT_607557 [Polyporus arcularius HHB13444]|uniref:Uncharacterized protein n=1 Tax=Polyporus arcularius HHB13444 TaxID=1314778 RepID=A0A5C3NMK1_9APHY|nr:hypothetical protein K466DRAFT_607557 [Polyporus arcularius HHB13444]